MWKYILLFGISITFFNARAQENEQNASKASDPSEHNSKASPNGGSGIFNVNLYTGTANINIPIHQYSIDGLDLGVSLSYDTRGIRVDQVASAVGLGWNLSAGGSITRSVYGVEDDQWLPALGYPYSDSPFVASWAGKLMFEGGHAMADGELDLFEANFAGRDIKFTVHRLLGTSTGLTASVVDDSDTYPKSHISIKLYFVNSAGQRLDYTDAYAQAVGAFSHYTPNDGSLGIAITDEKANTFYFEKGDYQKKCYTVDGITTSNPAGWRTGTVDDYGNPTIYFLNYYPITRWVLKEVQTYTGASIKYNYTKYDNIEYSQYKDQQVKEFDQDFYTDPGQTAASLVPHQLTIVADSAVKWSGGISQLSSIEYPNGTTINFIAGQNPNKPRCDMPGLYAVDSIIIHSGYDNQIGNDLTYRLNYSYNASTGYGNTSTTNLSFASPCTSIGTTYWPGTSSTAQSLAAIIMQTHLRLKLESIDFVGKDHYSKERYYSFLYESTPLPNRLSNSVDHFGYYNGKSSNNTYSALANLSIPLHTLTYQGNSITYGTDKTPDTTYLRAWNLIQVKNGMGGKLDLYYDKPSLYNPSYVYDTPTQVVPPDQEGKDANDGLVIAGIAESDGYNDQNTIMHTYAFGGGTRFYQGGYYWYPVLADSPNVVVYSKTYTNNYLQPRDFIDGSNHGYSQATVTTYNYNNLQLGKDIYDFTNLFDLNNPSISNLRISSAISYHTFRAKYFAQYRMGKVWKYQHYDPNNILVTKEETSFPSLVNGSLSILPATTMYMKKYFTWFLHSSSYADPDHMKTTTYPIYYVSRVFKPTDRTLTMFDGSAASVQTTSYQYDGKDRLMKLTSLDSKGNELSYNFGYKSNIQNHVGFRESWRVFSGSTGRRVNRVQTNFSNLLPFTSFTVESEQSLAVADPATQSGSLKYTNQVIHRDGKNNIVESIENEITRTAAIWDTRIGKQIAVVKNAAYSDIAYTSFEGSFAPKGTADDNKGNWDFNSTNIVVGAITQTSRPITGHYYYNLNTNNDEIVSKNSLTSGKKYLITFWANNLPEVVNGTAIVVHSRRQVDSWTLYTAEFVAVNDLVHIFNNTNSAISIDEVRLYPMESMITTTCYEPLFGPNSQCDNINNIIYNDYDVMGRIKVIRDIDKNILSVQKQATQDSDN